MAFGKVSSFLFTDKFHSSQQTVGIFCVWFLLIVGLQEVTCTVGDPCSAPSPSACSYPEEVCITSTNKCDCSADYYQTILDDCHSMDELKASNIQAPQRLTNSVTLTWSANKHGTSVTYTIQTSDGVSPVSGITENTVTVPGLTAGTLYTFTVTSVLPASGFHPEQSVSSTASSGFWTKPAKPGAVTDIQLVSEQPLIHDITFMASQGQVSHYTMTINSVTIYTGPSTTVRVTSLQPGLSYSYSITAYNGNNDPSEPSTGTLTTPVIASGPVSELMVSDITSDKVQVTWKKPVEPNGVIMGYTLTVSNGSTCVYGHIISCSDCLTPGPSGNIASCQNTGSENKILDELNDDTKTFNVHVSALEPYRNYTVSVTADNVDGTGMLDTAEFRTLVAAARDVTNVTAASTRNSITGVVSLTVTWTPGYFTGPTSYVVTLEEEISLGSNSFKLISVETVTGYNTNEWTKTDALAYWNYRVSVKAMTDAGNSSTVGSRMVRTETNSPGLPQDVTVQQDETVAQELALTITCPEEKERNGTITGYVIRKTLLDASGSVMCETEHTVPTYSSLVCINTYTAVDVGGIRVGKNYTFAVKVMNSDFNGSYSTGVALFVEPRAPRFEEILQSYKVPFLVVQRDSTTHQTAIDVFVCASCVLDSRQGTVTRVGLVVCKVDSSGMCIYSARKRRSLVSIEDIPTWGSAKAQDFNVPYRPTSNNWMSTLTAPNTSYPYRIGTDANCRTSADTIYCNGPLPTNTRFKVAVIQCNSVGCVIGTFEGPFRTGIDESDDTTLAIALGVVVPVVIIIAIIIVIVIVIKHRRRQQIKSEENQRPYNTMNTTMNDAHLYHGVTGRAYVSPTHTNPGGSDNIAMVGLQTPHASLHQRDDTEYTEPDHYDYIYDNDHHSSEIQPSQSHGRVRQTGGEVQNRINPYSNVSASMNAQRKRDYYNM